MHDAGNIFRCGFEFHRHHQFLNQFRCMGVDDVRTQNAIRFRICNNFYETTRLALPQRTAIGRERELASLGLNPFSFELLLIFTDPRDFG